MPPAQLAYLTFAVFQGNADAGPSKPKPQRALAAFALASRGRLGAFVDGNLASYGTGTSQPCGIHALLPLRGAKQQEPSQSQHATCLGSF